MIVAVSNRADPVRLPGGGCELSGPVGEARIEAVSHVSTLTSSTTLECCQVPLRDGTALAADVYRPQGGGRWPVLLLRLPYNRRLAQTILYAHPSWYAAHGYAMVVQDVRGRWASAGTFDPIAAEAADGADTIAWAASQPWSNGRVGMYGFSYPGMLQLLAGAERPPGLQAIVPALAPSQMREGWLYNGGAFALALALGWTLELGRDLARRLRPELEAGFAAALARRPHTTLFGRCASSRYSFLRDHAVLLRMAGPRNRG